jgi:6-phosphogluconolactonase
MDSGIMEYCFDSREEASAAVANRIAKLCAASVERQDDARIVVSGGSTPARCFELLSVKELGWQHVQVLMSDERWVSPRDQSSNERLVREKLLVNKASEANLLSLYRPDLSIDERAHELQAMQPAFGFACSMLGMGNDGHFASLFPDSNALEVGLDPVGNRFYIPVQTDASPYPRLSMSLSALLDSEEILLLFFGDDKMRVYREALLPESKLPIAHLLRQRTTPVGVYWSK